MKNIFLAILATLLVLSASSFAHTIEGTLVLKGSLKTKIFVNNLKTTCKVKIEKVKNLMQEDSYGNPAYNVRVDIDLSGKDHERDLSVKYNREFWLNNLFAVGNRSEVRDFEYASAEGVKMNIDRNGRIKKVSFPFQRQIITCSF